MRISGLAAFVALVVACSAAPPAVAPTHRTCTPDDVRQLVVAFVDAADRGDALALTAALATGVQFLDDRSVVGGGTDRSTQRDAIVDHFVQRSARGDRYRVIGARGNGPRDFEFEIGVSSREQGDYRILGKGQTNDPYDCADQRIAIWGMAAQPRSFDPGSPVATASADVALPPEYRAATGWSRLPAAITAALDTGPCAQARGLKVASRLDPPRRTAPDRWEIYGCLASPGNTFTNVYLELSFPDGTRLLARIADRTPADGELHYGVLVLRDRLDGVVASVLVVTP